MTARPAETLAQVLDHVLVLLGGMDDTGWSSFMTVPDAVAHYTRLRALSESDPDAAIRACSVEFLPTADLQELSLAGGWTEEYHRLAQIVDALEAGREP